MRVDETLKPTGFSRGYFTKVNRFLARNFFAGMYEIGARHAYLMLKGGDIQNKIIGAPDVDKSKEFRVMDIDGVPTTVLVCKKRYLGALLKCNTYSQVYNYLLQKLHENDIRELFYAIWIGYHNVKASKRIRAEKCKMNELKNRGVCIRHKQIVRDRMSVRQAAKTYGVL